MKNQPWNKIRLKFWFLKWKKNRNYQRKIFIVFIQKFWSSDPQLIHQNNDAFNLLINPLIAIKKRVTFEKLHDSKKQVEPLSIGAG